MLTIIPVPLVSSKDLIIPQDGSIVVAMNFRIKGDEAWHRRLEEAVAPEQTYREKTKPFRPIVALKSSDFNLLESLVLFVVTQSALRASDESIRAAYQPPYPPISGWLARKAIRNLDIALNDLMWRDKDVTMLVPENWYDTLKEHYG